VPEPPSELSGGEQQRVAIARALVNDPPLVLADEPTGELDSKTGAEIVALLREAVRARGKTFVIVTHEAALVEPGDRVVRLKDGKVVEDTEAETGIVRDRVF
jgi:putative ABC transport system ATP-binding protein